MRYGKQRRASSESSANETVAQKAVPDQEKKESDQVGAFDATIAAPHTDPNTVKPTIPAINAASNDPVRVTETVASSSEPASPRVLATTVVHEETDEIPPSLYTRFEAFELLGRGGMGVVYKARDIRLGRDVAVKILFGTDPQLGGSLLREARAQARIKHENVCEVYESGTIDQTRFIVMQVIHGESLDKAKETMSLEQKVRVIRLIASALHEAHRLGMVHRDVKPANIMVERSDDGTWKPYIMDFGLARDVGDSGSTVSGALMGTPSFMSPEQASGRVRSLDRRTDVYSLGATLYDIIVGRPPHEADGVAGLLQAIVFDEPLSPRQRNGDIPLDLDAIIMRSIEKQPSSRYESAKALGDELQRYLDGEPVAALKRAWLYALWRRAKRNKVRLTIATALLVVTTVFVGGWLRARQKAETQATLSRELGESVKEMEFFLRNAQGLPLHDIGRERKIVQQRLANIETLMKAAGDIGVGPGHYALGRGYLALQDFENAIDHLQQATAAGYHAAGLDYAMGLALGEVYKKELAETKRIEGERKKQRIAEIEALYKKPSLEHLKASIGSTLEATSFAEGLIAFYEGRLEEALPKAREAFEKAPWLYEAKKLEGDVLFAMGSKFGHDAAFDYDKMSKWFGEADDAYRIAAEIGSSDPAVHLAMCDLYVQKMNGQNAGGKAIQPSFEDATGACDKANRANPSSGSGYLKLAQVYTSFAWHVNTGDDMTEKAAKAIDEALKQVDEATRRNPAEPMAPYLRASLWRTRARYADNRRLEMVSATNQAIAAYDESLHLDPYFVWALNESCSLFNRLAQRESMHGVAPSAKVAEAKRRCSKAVEVAPDFVYATLNQIYSQILLAEYQVQRGASPQPIVNDALAMTDALQKWAPNATFAIYYRALLLILDADYQIESGADATSSLARAEQALAELSRVLPTGTITYRARGLTAMNRARLALQRAEDPSQWLAAAKEAFGAAMKAQPWDVEYRVAVVAVESMALRLAIAQGGGTEPELDAARKPVESLLDVDRDDPSLYLVLAEIDELRATLRVRKGDEVKGAIDDSLAWVAKALAINPHMARALACKARLSLLRATAASDAREKKTAAEMALEGFAAAIRENPLIERQERSRMVTAQKLAQGEAAKTP